MRMLFAVSVVTASSFAACSEPSCRPGEIQIGQVCEEIERDDAGSADQPGGSTAVNDASHRADDAGRMDAENPTLPAERDALTPVGSEENIDAASDSSADAAENQGAEIDANAGAEDAGNPVAPEPMAPTCTPAPEVCDDDDDDCDGKIDEGVKNACQKCGPVPAEVCSNSIDDDCDGVINEDCCVATPEVCDNDDDDCDGKIDEGVKNACQKCGAVPAEDCSTPIDDDCDGVVNEGCCVASPEACDNEDNDCDGKTDEGVKNACQKCGAVPAEDCSTPADDNCNGVVNEGCCVPTTEVCDGKDNDCDEKVDEDVIEAPLGTSCTKGKGVCQGGGTWVCKDGVPQCNAVEGTPSTMCPGSGNHLDDDCDGTVDELQYYPSTGALPFVC